MPNCKDFYPGLDTLGKHYTVQWLESHGKARRHYTICNVMKPAVYTKVVQHLKNGNKYERSNIADVNRSEATSATGSGTGANFGGAFADLNGLFSTEDQNHMGLGVKNYNQPRGCSVWFFDHQEDDEFLVKGPMGKSLGVQNSGLHIIFAGGTGILPFMDLVAQLCYFNLGLNHLLGNKQTGRITDGFKLKLYVSFRDRNEAIGLDMLEALESYCKRNSADNFELIVRISNESKGGRWNDAWIDQQLADHSSKTVKKIWVCGPPVMNETFDRKFKTMCEE